MDGGTSHVNRRAAYRVEPDEADDLDLAMLSRRQRIVPVEVGDVAIGGAQLRIPAEDASEVEPGDAVSVAITSKRLAYDGEIPARVCDTRTAGDAHIVHLSFLGNTADLDDPPAGVFELLNRRSSYRGVGPGTAGTLPALVMPRGGDASLQGYPVGVHNISNTGVSLEIDDAAHAALEDRAALQLVLELPDRASPVAIACRIRHRGELDEGWLYGCEYDWSDTSDSLAVVEDLVGYILDASNGEG